MKEFKDTLIRHSSRTNKDRVKYMADILRRLCVYCLVPDVYSNDERIHNINTILPILEKFEHFDINKEYLSKKAQSIVEKAQKSVSSDPVGFKFALALNEMVNISKQVGNDKNVLLEAIDITITVLKAKRTMLQKAASGQNEDMQLEVNKRRKTDSVDTAKIDADDNSKFLKFN